MSYTTITSVGNFCKHENGYLVKRFLYVKIVEIL